ncbi:histidine kinase [Paraburkholderia nemoris]|uniref:sensor histidine kinase n=1 Tax=Paraburkholderia nemoris TaxID=2793076 RepID=UPI0038B937B8
MRIRGIPLWGWAAAAALYFGVAAAAVGFVWDHAIDVLAEVGGHRLALYAADLQSELVRHEMIPAIVARQESVRALLSAPPPAPPDLLQTVNTYLEAVNREAGSVAVDVIDLHGSVIAASNSNLPVSFIGTNVSYRPYFKDSLAHGSGRFFGIGTNTGIPGLYFASAVRDGTVPIGVTAVKVSLDALESAWRTPAEAAMVVDGNGVIVISTVPAWKFMALRPVTAAQQIQIQASRQYAGRTVQALPHRRLGDWSSTAWFARFPDWTRPNHDRRYLVVTRSVLQTDESIMVLLDVAGARHQQLVALAFVTGGFLIAGLYCLYATQRRHAITEKLKAQGALRSANDQLEITVQQRTAALTQANERMLQEIEERTRTQQELLESREQLRELSAHMEAIREEERKRIALEIHDELGQLLTALKIDVSLLKMRLGGDPEAKRKADDMRELVEKTIWMVRNVANHLRPAALNFGIVPALEWLVEDFSRRNGIPCQLRINGGEPALPDACATVVFRIVQASLTNILRHAGATRVDVALTSTAAALDLRVSDDGRGFDPATACSGNSYGLLGMRERARLIGGTMTIDSAAGTGTVIGIHIPLPAGADNDQTSE